MNASLKSLTLIGLSALFLSMAIQPAKAAVITLSGGDAGEGLTLVPADVVAAENVQGVTATLQTVAFPKNGSQISFVTGSTGTGSALTNYTPTYVVPPSPTANDSALGSLLNRGGFALNQPLSVVFTGLVPNESYLVELLIADLGSFTRQLNFTYNGVAAPSDTFTTVIGQGYNVRNFIQANGSGTILATIRSPQAFSNGSPTPGQNPIISSAVLSVPEPSTWAMGGVGIAFAATCREFRRRRRVNLLAS